MNNLEEAHYHEQIINFLENLSQDTGDVINAEYCKRQLERLTQPPSLRNRIFYVIFNLKEQEITWSRFVHQTLGFQDINLEKPSKNQITFRKYLGTIKPNYLPIYTAFGSCAYRLAKQQPQVRAELHKMNMQCMMQLPIRLKDGKYYWTTQVGIPFEVDSNNNLVSNINVYEIGLEYNGQKMLKPMILLKDGKERRTDLEKMLQQQLSEDFFEEFLGFKAKVVQLIKKYNEENPLNIETVADDLKTPIETIKAYNKLIKQRVNQYFSEDINPFPDAKSAARYLGRLLGDYLVLK
ncbi:MAG: hypothetical protein AAGG68_04670 [Bacteroidota bacterium]